MIASPISGVVGSGISGLPGSGGLGSLTRWRAAKAAVTAGTADAILAIASDSTGVGYGALAANTIGAEPYCWPTVLAGLLTNARSKSFFSDKNIGTVAGLIAYDARVGGGTNYVVGTVLAFGRWFIALASPNTDSITFTCSGVDTADIYDGRSASSAVWSWSVDGGGATSAGGTGTNLYRKTTVSLGTLGTHTLSLQRVSGGTFFLGGVVMRNSAAKEITFVNFSQNSAQISDMIASGSPWSTIPALQTLAPALTIICLTINGWSSGAVISTFTSQHQTLIDAALISGDVLLVTGAPSATSVASVATQQLYIDAYTQLARDNNLRMLNMTQAWGSYAQADAAGLMRDTKHPNATGYADIAARIFAIINP